MYKIQDVMTEEVVTIGPDATIDQAISLLLNNEVSGLPVVDEQQVLLGVITEIDIIDLVYKGDLEDSVVGDHMTRTVSYLAPDASLDDAANIFCNNSIRRIPVVRDDRLVGVISRHDLIGFVHDVRKQNLAAAGA